MYVRLFMLIIIRITYSLVDCKKVWSRKSKKGRQCNGQKGQNDQRANKLVQYTTRKKIKDRATRIPLKTGGDRRCSGRISNSCSTSGTYRFNFVIYQVISLVLFIMAVYGKGNYKRRNKTYQNACTWVL